MTLNIWFETGPKRNSKFCFLRICRGKHWALGNKINCFQETSLLSGLLCSWKFWSWQWLSVITFAGTSALLPSEIADFAILPAQRIWWETVSLLDVMWLWSNRWEHALMAKNFQLYNKHDKLLFISALCSYLVTVTAAMLIPWFHLAFYNHIIRISSSNIFLKKLSKEFKRDAHNIEMWFIFYITQFADVTKNCNFSSFLPKNHHHILCHAGKTFPIPYFSS